MALADHLEQRVRRQRFCSGNCRKTAWARTRRQPAAPTPPVPPRGRQSEATVYAWPACDIRLYGQQWCADCNQPCTRVGFGGLCPHCQEPVALTDLLHTPQQSPKAPQGLTSCPLEWGFSADNAGGSSASVISTSVSACAPHRDLAPAGAQGGDNGLRDVAGVAGAGGE